MTENILCESCGLPINMANPSITNCVRCNHPDGSPKTTNEVKYGIISYFINHEQMTPDEAKTAAEPYISKL